MAGQEGRPADPNILVIFGASGDLTERKLIPALYNLTRDGLLSGRFAVVGVSRSEMSHEEFRDHLEEGLREHMPSEVDGELWQGLRDRLYYSSGDVNDEACYAKLGKLLDELQTSPRSIPFFRFTSKPPWGP